MQMRDWELASIEQRAELFTRYGDRDALRPEDVVALLAEVRQLRRDNRHLIALHRQDSDRLTAAGLRPGKDAW